MRAAKAAILIGIGIPALLLGLAVRGNASGRAEEHVAAPRGALLEVAFNRHLNRAIVVDERGISVYAFSYDDEGKPACYVDPGYRCVKSWPSCVDDPQYHCSKEWPPLTTIGRPRAAKGVNAKLLGVARRRDGRLQVTYRRHPLYFYAGGLGPPPDKKQGDVNGQGFVGLWYAVSPKGVEIK